MDDGKCPLLVLSERVICVSVF